MLDEKAIRVVLGRAFSLGQVYWRQADSQSYADNRQSEVTLSKFRELVEEVVSQMRGGNDG